MDRLNQVSYPKGPDYWIQAISEPRHVPNYSAVYIVVDRDGYVKYVGQTTNLRSRYKDHWNVIITECDAVGWIRCEEDELMFMECWFIAVLRPYKNGNANKKTKKVARDRSVKVTIKPEKVWKPGRTVRLQGKALASSQETGRIGSIHTDDWWYNKSDMKEKYIRVGSVMVSKCLATVLLD